MAAAPTYPGAAALVSVVITIRSSLLLELLSP
jgi:hypothetical protein